MATFPASSCWRGLGGGKCCPSIGLGQGVYSSLLLMSAKSIYSNCLGSVLPAGVAPACYLAPPASLSSNFQELSEVLPQQSPLQITGQPAPLLLVFIYSPIYLFNLLFNYLNICRAPLFVHICCFLWYTFITDHVTVTNEIAQKRAIN